MKTDKFKKAWFKDLDHKQIPAAKQAIAEGRKWAESGRSIHTVETVARYFLAITKGNAVSDEEYERSLVSLKEAVADDETLYDVMHNVKEHHRYIGWFCGVCEAFDEMCAS